MRQTTMLKPSEVVRQWYVVDGTGLTLGRLSTVVASVLRGKNKPTYTPNVDCGDYVIVTNADKIVVIDAGKIVEVGSHKELTELRGAYYKLVKNQLELGN